jgi:hypothetical protein
MAGLPKRKQAKTASDRLKNALSSAQKKARFFVRNRINSEERT